MTTVRMPRLPDGGVIDLLTHGEDDYLTRRLRAGWYELDLLTAIQGFGRRGVYVDVGAHIGSLAVWMGRCCPATEIVAIEPYAASAEILEHNLAAALGLTAVPWRVIWEPAGARGDAVALGPPFGGNTGNVAGSPRGSMLCCSIDGLSLSDVAVIKIDVQGMECRVLTGAMETIARDRPIIAAEAMTEPERVELFAHPALAGYDLVGRYCASPTYLWAPR